MIVAYEKSAEAFAKELQKMGFTVVDARNESRYDSFIYIRTSPGGLLNVINNNEKTFLLNVSGLTTEKAARMLLDHTTSR